ncbi:MAG: hypothetical protein RLZZ05_1014 [Bacteroidota bacterium]
MLIGRQDYADIIGIAKAMNQPKSQGHAILDGMAGNLLLLKEQIHHCSDQDCTGNQKFNPINIQIDEFKNTQEQGNSMSDGKRCDQDQDLSPVCKTVDDGQNGYKKKVVCGGRAHDVEPADLEIKYKILHVLYELKLIRLLYSMKRLAYFLFLLAIPLLMGSTHPFFVAITELEYSSKTKELGIATKFFPDDLEEALRKFSGKKYDVVSGEKKTTGDAINTYFNKHVQVLINGKPKQINFLGYEIEKEVVWVYYNSTKLTGVKSIEVISTLMYDYKAEHTNIIHIKMDEKRQGFKLNAPDQSAKLSR